MERSVRVAMFGNTANNFFQIGRGLRARGNVDAHLFVNSRDPRSTRPEADDPTLDDGYPEWIHEGDFFPRSAKFVPWRSPLLSALEGFDALLVSGLGPVVAQFSRLPWGFFVTGGDLTVTPFPIRLMGAYSSTMRDRSQMLAVGPWQRSGIRRARAIYSQPFSPFRVALDRLRVDPGRISDRYLPILIDPDYLPSLAAAAPSPDGPAAEIRARSDFVVFHPSRLIIEAGPERRLTGDWKANDVLIRGFAEFARSRAADAPLLVIPDRTESPDVALAKRIAADEGIEASVQWVTPPRPAGFNRHELADFYAVADAVADDFGVGWFGSVVIEACTMSRPVISHIDEAAMSRLYPWHPVVEARNPASVAARLAELAGDPELRRELGSKGREWVMEFHSYENALPRYEAAIEELARLPATRSRRS